MTQEEINEYASRVEAMAKKEPAYTGWGFFYYKSVYNKELTELCEMKKKLQHRMQLKHLY